jgi:hypothetical protein
VMDAHGSALVSLSTGFLAALAGAGGPAARSRPIAPDAVLAWIGGSPPDDDARLLHDVVSARPRARHDEVVAEAAGRLFRRDLARLGGAADIGFLQPFYRAYAQELVRRLVGDHLRIEEPR